MLSFKQAIYEQTHKQQREHEGPFTRLKQNITKKSYNSEAEQLKVIYKQSVTYLMKKYQLQFEIFKLEKANEVVRRYLKTGTPIRSIVEQIMENL